MSDERHPAVERLERETGDVGSRLERLAGSDLASLLLDVMRRRSAGRTPAEVLAQYERDRFTRPGAVDARRLVALEGAALDAVADRFEPVVTSPLAPLGAHSVIAGVAQDRVVTTVRSTEVAADPTNSLALEAAVRRRSLLRDDPRSSQVVRLAAVDRVVRAQRFDGSRSFAHFSLLGLVSAGRDIGSREFEQRSLVEHVGALVDVCRSLGFDRVVVRLTAVDGRFGEVLDRVAERLDHEGVVVTSWPEREDGRGYYPQACFKLDVPVGDETVEVGDGGLVDWTQTLLGSRKERLMISGLSTERLAMLDPPAEA